MIMSTTTMIIIIIKLALHLSRTSLVSPMSTGVPSGGQSATPILSYKPTWLALPVRIFAFASPYDFWRSLSGSPASGRRALYAFVKRMCLSD